MAQPTQTLEAAQGPPDKDEAYQRMAKAILRSKAVDRFVRAIKGDVINLPRTEVMAQRSIKVLDYMRGYIKAVEEEEQQAIEQYETAVYAARVQHESAFKKERKSSLARVRRNPHPTEPTK